MSNNFQVPQHLVDRFRSGRVVLFVGAGFSSAAGFPAWKQLLLNIAQHGEEEAGVDKRTTDAVRHLLRASAPSAHDLDQAAQLMDDALDNPSTKRQTEMVSSIRRFLTPKLPLNPIMENRLRIVADLPARAILTTNFNPLFKGRTPFDANVSEYYAEVLRSEGLPVVQDSFVATTEGDSSALNYRAAQKPILQIHGNLDNSESVVLTRDGYRNLLYACPHYNTFLKSCLGTYTILYIGVSFSDAYLNELRSEIVGLLGPGKEGEPLAYTILNDRTEVEQQFYLRHEGVRVLTYDTQNYQDWSGFDKWLQAIHDAVCC